MYIFIGPAPVYIYYIIDLACDRTEGRTLLIERVQTDCGVAGEIGRAK